MGDGFGEAVPLFCLCHLARLYGGIASEAGCWRLGSWSWLQGPRARISGSIQWLGLSGSLSGSMQACVLGESGSQGPLSRVQWHAGSNFRVPLAKFRVQRAVGPRRWALGAA